MSMNWLWSLRISHRIWLAIDSRNTMVDGIIITKRINHPISPTSFAFSYNDMINPLVECGIKMETRPIKTQVNNGMENV